MNLKKFQNVRIKNLQIVIVIFYTITIPIVIYNWDYISEIWNKGSIFFMSQFSEPTSGIALVYYMFISFYVGLFLLSPLLLLDRKYLENNEQTINLLNINKESIIKTILNVLLIIIFPLIGMVAMLFWAVISITAWNIGYILGMIFFGFIILIMIYILIKSLIHCARIIKTKMKTE